MSLLELSGFTVHHDPVIVKENNIYYCFSTHGIVGTSHDLHTWSEPYRVLEKNFPWVKDVVPGNENDIWAPEVVYRNGVWRMYYSLSAFGQNVSAIGMAESPVLNPYSPDYGWKDCGCVIASKESDNFNAIDPAVCSDENGDDWLLFGSFWSGLKMIRLDKDGKVMTGAELISVASRGHGGEDPLRDENPIEGGFIFPHDKKYFLFASHDFCCRGTASTYHIVAGVSDKITGPYLDYDEQPMLTGGGTTLRSSLSFGRFAGPGHNSLFHDTDGKDYLVYHAYDRKNNGMPHLMIEPVIWKDNWPELD